MPLRFSAMLAGALALLPAVGAAAPGTARAPLAADTNLPCSAALAPIEFGMLNRSGTSVPVMLSVSCPAGVPFEVRILDPGGCGAVRTIPVAGTGTLRYQIFLPGGTALWCDGTNGTATLKSVGTGGIQVFDGIARADGNTAGVVAGTYRAQIQFVVITGE